MPQLNLTKTAIAMIHVPALPGTPQNNLNIAEICHHCQEEAKLYRQAQVDAIAIENMHDIPYLKGKVGPEIIASMTMVARAVKEEFLGPIGIQILAAANQEALAVALAADLDFIRAEGFVFGHLADEGYIDSCAGELLRYRKQIGAEKIQVFTDIKKKHSSHSISSDLGIVETAQAADFFLSDGVIITGGHTGSAPDLKEISQVRSAISLPVILGSGITVENLEDFFPLADAFIVGSFFKEEGHWKNPLSFKRTQAFMEKLNSLRLTLQPNECPKS